MAVYFDSAHKSYYCKFRYVDWTGKQRSTTKRGFARKKDALKYETTFKQNAASSPVMTVKDLADKYLEDCKHRLRDNTFIQRESMLRLNVYPSLGNLMISKVTPAIIRKWQNTIIAKYSVSSANLINTLCSCLFNFAVKTYGLKTSPFDSVPSIGRSESRLDFYELEQFNQLIDHLPQRKYPLKLFYMILFYSGMRVGEMQALEVNDLDFVNNKISINKTYTYCTMKISPPKTSSSNRTISMPKDIMADIKKYLATLPVVPQRPFATVAAQTLRTTMQKVAKEIGLPVISIHGLRHSHASYLIHAGIPITDVSRRLGHSNASISLKVYSHFYHNGDENIASMLQNTISAPQIKNEIPKAENQD